MNLGLARLMFSSTTIVSFLQLPVNTPSTSYECNSTTNSCHLAGATVVVVHGIHGPGLMLARYAKCSQLELLIRT